MIVVVQYGETEASAKKTMVGQSPSDLTMNGRDLANQYAEALSGMIIDYAFVPNVPAAVRTAEEILRGRSLLSLTSVSALAEPSAGNYEGRLYSELKKVLPPRQYRLWDRDFFVAPPNGESLRDVTDRVQGWIKQSKLDETQNHLFVVGPQVMKILLGLFQKLEEADICALEPLFLPYSFDRYSEL